MRNIYCLFLGLMLTGLTFPALAQSVGIGTTSPNAKAALDIQSTSGSSGLLIPRLTAAQRMAIVPAPQGLLVYQTDGTASGGPQTGFWYYAGSPAAWVFLNPGGAAADNLGNHTATQALHLQGNALTGTGASIGSVVGLGVRADGGLNIGQNTAGHNVFLGYQAGQATTTGTENQFLGFQSGYGNTQGTYNLFVGNESGFSNTSGNINLFQGYQSGYGNTVGSNNLFIGHFSGLVNASNSNLFIGHSSGQSNTTGSENHFVGFHSGQENSSGRYNQFSGFRSGLLNSTGSQNHFDGYESGYNSQTSSNNHFAGYKSGRANTTGHSNTFLGLGSGLSNTTGSYNQFVGDSSGVTNTTSSRNQFSGYQSGYSNTSGSLNYFSGYRSGYANTTGQFNYFSGYQSGMANTNGDLNHFTGFGSGESNTTGHDNHFDGSVSGRSNTTGSYNHFDGSASGYSNTAGSINHFSGNASGYRTTIGSNNLFVGQSAGYENVSGSNNLAFGFHAGPAPGLGALHNAGAIGYQATVRQNNSLVLGGTGINAVSVGLGTGAPASRLHVYSTDAALPAVLRLQTAASGAFGTAGLDFYSDPQGNANEWRPAYLRSTDAGDFTGGLAFYTNGTGSGSKTGSVEGMRLVNGQLGIGTTAPQARLDVAGGGGSTTDLAVNGRLRSGDASNVGGLWVNSAMSQFVGQYSATTMGLYNNGWTLLVANNGRVGIGTATPGYELDVVGTLRVNSTLYTSDARLKQQLRPLAGALASVLALRGVRYTWNALGVQRGGTAGLQQVGLLAQEVEQIYPELVSTDAQGYKAVNYAQLTPVLIEALKEQQLQVQALQADNAELRRQQASTAANVRTLQAQMARLLGESPTPATVQR